MRTSTSLLAGLVGVCSGTTYYASPHGTDSNDGSLASPVASLAACVQKLKGPGDECRLRAGTYSGDLAVLNGVSGKPDAPIVIAAYENEEVLIDGTEPVTCKWTKDSQGLWTCTADAVQQLWVDGEMQTIARWPDALWSDRSVFDWTRWSRFAGSPWGPFPPGTPDPIAFHDHGPLAESKLDATGAMFVGVIAHMDTFDGTVTNHTAGSNVFSVQLHINKIGNSKSGNSIYYLENLPAFANQKGEWAYDLAKKQLWLNSDSPVGKDVRRKVQSYALEITASENVVVANMTFFGTTVNAQNIPNMEWNSLVFNYPSFANRTLGDWHAGQPTVFSGSDLKMINCTFFGGDGPTLRFSGDRAHFENNLFDSNDFCTVDANTHTGLGGWIIDASGHTGDTFIRNTMKGNGPSVAYVTGRGATVKLNYFEGEADIQNDGASVQIRSGSATNTVLMNNWALSSAKGWRLDSGSNTGFSPGEVNNTIHGNVAFRTNGFMLKNDYNFYTNNLALLGPVGAVHGSNQGGQLFRVDTTRYSDENSHSINQGNVASTWEKPIAGKTSATNPNVFYAEVADELRDPMNLDFRPRVGSNCSKTNAGPYAADSKQYWIPGRQSYSPSTPIPPHGTTSAQPDADLMFLAAYKCDVHQVYFGTSEDKLALLGTLKTGENIQSVTDNGPLVAGRQYYWRVDAVDAQGVLRRGAVWSFVVRQ